MIAPARGLVALAAAAAAHAAPAACRYDVSVSPHLDVDVEVRCDAGVQSLADTGRLVTDLTVTRDADGLRAAYRVGLGAVARDGGNLDTALGVGRSLLAPGSTWLLQPVRGGPADAPIRISVRLPAGVEFAAALPVAGGTFRIDERDIPRAGFNALGHLDGRPLRAPDGAGGTVEWEVVVLDGPLDVGRDALLEWIGRQAGIMTAFWHGFPAPGMKLFVVPRTGRDGVPFGRALGGGGVTMVIYVGEHATREQLDDDWVLIHELVHAGSPFVRGSPWLMEGLATYFEPLLRARDGLRSEADLWTEFMTHMPRGAAVLASTGLARGGFRGWYWGGGLLMLLADLEIREASGGVTGLEDCLRAIRRDVGNAAVTMGVREMIDACDAATGDDVLARLAERHVSAANPVDLDALWTSLGLRLENGRAIIDDDAPRARARKAMLLGAPAP